uniref:Putative secreted protein n=1 Tax=Ixodes ricinus TaxID=34613 RepID=A0A6B0U734_IXORI
MNKLNMIAIAQNRLLSTLAILLVLNKVSNTNCPAETVLVSNDIVLTFCLFTRYCSTPSFVHARVSHIGSYICCKQEITPIN